MKNSNTPSKLTDLGRTVSFLCERVQSLLDQHVSAPRERILIALAGVPGSGKSTTSSRLITALQCRGIIAAVVAVVSQPKTSNNTLLLQLLGSELTMVQDGFHYCKAALAAFPDPELAFRRRGAPSTFDVNALLELVSNLRQTHGGDWR